MTNHVRLYVLVKLPRYEPCRPYRPGPIMAAKVPFNHGQSVVDVGVRPEARRQVLLVNKEIWDQPPNHNDLIKQIAQPGCQGVGDACGECRHDCRVLVDWASHR